MPTAMVTFNGRITLPAQVRKQLGLKTGDRVDFVEDEHGRISIVHGEESSLHLEQLAAQEDATEAIL